MQNRERAKALAGWLLRIEGGWARFAWTPSRYRWKPKGLVAKTLRVLPYHPNESRGFYAGLITVAINSRPAVCTTGDRLEECSVI
jgi:hypothetical protein